MDSESLTSSSASANQQANEGLFEVLDVADTIPHYAGSGVSN